MNIYLNKRVNPSGMITFNNTPTILYIESSGSGSKAKMEIAVGVGADFTTQYYFEINGIKVVSTLDIKRAVGNVFYTPIALMTGSTYEASSAYSLSKALNNTELANDYNIYIDNQDKISSSVIIEAKEEGSKYDFKNVNTNADFLSYTVNGGSSDDILAGSIVTLDVYANPNPLTQNNISGNGSNLKHVGTFQKRYFKNGISFNISPILSNITIDGNTVEYNIVCNYINQVSEMKQIGSILHNYAVNGYQCNLGLDFIPSINNVFFAQNVNRGDSRSTYNNTTLYYVDDITFSFYKSVKGEITITINELDSALNVVNTRNISTTTNKPLTTVTITPNRGAYYVDVVLPQGTIRYNNIRPEKYANPSDIQTLYWYNSYGGVSFMPFTGKKEETRESDKILYKRNSFSYYNEGMKSYQKVYDIENTYEVNLTSHYMDKNGTYLMNDLNNAYTAWTYVEGKKYEIIIKSVEVDEQSNNNVFVAKVKFEYSLADRW